MGRCEPIHCTAQNSEIHVKSPCFNPLRVFIGRVFSVIPAQAGIHAATIPVDVDSRLRGNDGH
jgi:hypothetical protein